MAQIDKIYIQEEGLTYNIAQSPDATFSAISNDTDTASAKSWTEVDKLVSGETNGSIFNKMSKMFSNIRYLYNELGGSSGSGGSIIQQITTLKEEKANLYHRHNVSDIDNVTDQLTDATRNGNYLPNNTLINSLNTKLDTIKAKANDLADKMGLARIP